MSGTAPLPFGDVLLDIERVLRTLVRHGVRFVLVGGVASLLHGSPLPTEDVDVTPERSADNLAALAAALRDLGAQWCVEGLDAGFPPVRPIAGADLEGKLSAALVTPAGFVDVVLVHSDGARFEQLVADAVVYELYGLAVPVASLDAIIASKQAAARPKDARALPFLDELRRRRASQAP